MAKLESSTCKTCSKNFTYYASTRTGKYCSRECIKYTKTSGSFKDQGKKKQGVCLGCDKKFSYYKSTRTGKYCSKDCYYKVVDVSERLPKDVSGEKNPFYGKSHEKSSLPSGEDHWNWKGGLTDENIKERMKFVQTIGREVMKRDGYKCTLCDSKSGDLHVDHIQPWSEYVKLRFCIDNCRTVCRECHYKLTFNKEMPQDSKWGLYSFGHKMK